MKRFFLLSLLFLSCAFTSFAQESEKELQLAVEIIEFPDVEAEFIGGNDALLNYMISSIRYPMEAIDKGISGKVFLTFIVEIDGSISTIEIKKGVHPLLDAEAIRFVEAMPKWKPGTAGGKNVRTRCRIPVVFSL